MHIPFLAKTTFFFALLVLHGLTARGGEVRLESMCQIAASVVRLSDVATFTHSADEQRLGPLALFPAPRVGQTRHVSAQDVRETLAILGADLAQVQITGTVAITTVPATQEASLVQPVAHVHEVPQAEPQTAERAADAAPGTDSITLATQLLLDYLAERDQREAQWRVVPQFTGEAAERVAAMQQPEVSGGSAPFTGRQFFAVRDARRPQEKPLFLKADVERLDVAIVARRRLLPGEIVLADDVERRAVPARLRSQLAVTDEAAAVGLQVTKVVAEGQVIQSTHLRRQLLVTKGEQLTVFALAAGISIKTSARALDDGALGDVIWVQAADATQRLQARVTAPQEATVFVDSPRVVAPPPVAPPHAAKSASAFSFTNTAASSRSK